MINLVTGDVSFQDGLYIQPHHPIQLPHKTRKLSLKTWTRHILGLHASDYGTFEVEALSTGRNNIQLVLLAHRDASYKPSTLEDAERRAFHESIIRSDLSGQREFSWREVVCRWEARNNKDWLVVAYNQGANVPLPGRPNLLRLFAID